MCKDGLRVTAKMKPTGSHCLGQHGSTGVRGRTVTRRQLLLENLDAPAQLARVASEIVALRLQRLIGNAQLVLGAELAHPELPHQKCHTDPKNRLAEDAQEVGKQVFTNVLLGQPREQGNRDCDGCGNEPADGAVLEADE